jgi:hypothetical protein
MFSDIQNHGLSPFTLFGYSNLLSKNVLICPFTILKPYGFVKATNSTYSVGLLELEKPKI